MMDMPKLMLKPLRADYSLSLARNVAVTETEGGMPRERKDNIGRPHKTNPTYKCTRAQWSYFLAFSRVYEGLPFLAELLVDDVNHQWYECRILNQVFDVTTLGDQIFTVQLSLVVKPIKYDVEVDKAIIAIHEVTGGKSDLYFNLLEKLVNEDLPKIKKR